jgi:hypothetical protein
VTFNERFIYNGKYWHVTQLQILYSFLHVIFLFILIHRKLSDKNSKLRWFKYLTVIWLHVSGTVDIVQVFFWHNWICYTTKVFIVNSFYFCYRYLVTLTWSITSSAVKLYLNISNICGKFKSFLWVKKASPFLTWKNFAQVFKVYYFCFSAWTIWSINFFSLFMSFSWDISM